MNESIIKLREETGAGIMDCKRALDEAGGDFEKAQKLIFDWGFSKASKKGDRKMGAGYLEAYIHGGRIGVLLELRCETDFVAKNDKFKELSHDIVMQIASMNPESVEELLGQAFIKNPSLTINDLLTQSIATIGENMKIERFTRYEL